MKRLLMAVIVPIVLLGSPAAADDKSDEAIRKYREMLKEASPGELYVVMGEELWRAPRGPSKVSLERCDFGLGPGVLKGAYAQLPRYFADTDKVEDLESRIATCMRTLQGRAPHELPRHGFGDARMSDFLRLAALGLPIPQELAVRADEVIR